MDSNSSEEEDYDSDVFYSCDSEYLSSNSPIKSSVMNDSIDGPVLPETESFDPISLNIMRKLSISSSSSSINLSTPIKSSNNLSPTVPVAVNTKVRFAESHITYNIEQIDEEDYEYDYGEDSDDEKENKKVGVELKKVFTRIITKAEEVQKTVVSKIERKKDPPTQETTKAITTTTTTTTAASPTKWLKDLIVPTRNPTQTLKNAVTSYARRKSKREFGSLVCVQTIDVHEGAIWTMKFSYDGAFMASGGQDGLLRIWRVNTNKLFAGQPEFSYFQKPPANVFHGHNGDILDVSWSKTSNKILSASMDRTVRLWLLDKDESVHSFQHTDIVTSVSFHPTDDNIFLTGSLDNKLMLWNIEQKTAIHMVDTQEFITTVSFTLDGKMIIAGLHSGMCRFFSTENLVSSGSLHVHSSRGKNKKGKKISGIEALPDGKSILITSNDSRIRLYKLEDYSCECKYKGLVNNSFQIKGSSSANGNYVICGSEDNIVYIWNTRNDNAFFATTDSIPIIGSGTRKDVNASYECFGVNTRQPVVITVALFSPHTPPPGRSNDELQPLSPSTSPPDGELVTLSSSNPTPSSANPISNANNSNNRNRSTSNPAPFIKALPHRNSISSIFNLITPNSNKNSTSKTLPSNSSSSSILSKPTTPDGATSSNATPIPANDNTTQSQAIASSPPQSSQLLSTSPPPSNNNNNSTNKKTTNSGMRVPVFGNSMEMVVDDQLVYIVTADAAGQIKVFENLPLQSLSVALPTNTSTSATPSPSTSPIPTSAPIIPSPLALNSSTTVSTTTANTTTTTNTTSTTSTTNNSTTPSPRVPNDPM